MLPAAASTREQRLWAEELVRLRAAAPTLEPAVRRSVEATLRALAVERATDAVTRRDAIALLRAIERAAAPPRERRRRRIHLRGPRDLHSRAVSQCGAG